MDASMTIDGRAVRGAAGFDVVNPATGAAFAQAPEATRDDVDRAMAAAERSMPAWRADHAARSKALHAVADVLRENAAALGETITREMGKPLAAATREGLGAAMYFDYYADLELPVETLRDDGGVRAEVHRRPVGPVVAITPWNGPVVLTGTKVAPALAAGNPVVLKPSPHAPLSALLLGELIRDVLPPGVFAVLTGSGDLGRWVTEHPVPRKITFTGSTAVGRQVALAAARDLKRVTLELGGNDPAIALDDVDAESFARAVTAVAFSNAGQVCLAPKRVYVPAARHDELAEAFAAAVSALRVGDGFDPETQMGPVATAAQRDRVDGLVRDAAAHGGRVHRGSRPDGPGSFYAPTLVTAIGDGVALVDEEQFGPALPLVAYRSEAEAITAANGTPYGLGSSVWSADPDRAEAVADQLVAGHTWVNTHFASVGPAQPLMGVKASGLGVEGGTWGLASFTEPHVRYVVTPPPADRGAP